MACHMKRPNNTSTDVVDNVDAMHEIFRHLDAESLGVASCVSRRWQQAAMDDSLWEVICTKQLPCGGICTGRLRCVVNVLGGFRRLYVKWLHPLRRNAPHAVSACKNSSKENNVILSEEQVQLSLSLFSVEYYGRFGTLRNGSCYGSPSTLSNPRLLRNVHGSSRHT